MERYKTKGRVRNPAIPDYTQKKEVEPTISFTPCIVCRKVIGEGPYGRWQAGNTCSKRCNTAQSQKEKEYVDDDGNRH